MPSDSPSPLPAFSDEPIVATIVQRAVSNETSTPALASPKPSELVPQRSGFEAFFDSFFRRENIRWLAVIGAAIVIASSLMMVTREWSNWPVTAKFFVILGYTGVIYLFSEFGRKQLGLQITARVLQYLTLLLLPISFLALSWLLSADSGSFLGVSGLHFTALAAPALALSWYASSKIFAFLWRGEQRTFLASYLILCVSGALPTLHDSGIALTVSFALWMVATIGAIKINRHIFWMTEEHRLPRAFGFLPILLLGLQFMVLVILKAGAALPVEWIGLGLVLTSSTVLMTARTVADVHRQRTGGNLRPLPWNILAPLMVGVTLSLIGVLVSFYGFSYGPGSTRAVVPTTLLAGAMMFVVARQTNQQAFTWIGLVLITITYQSTPTLVSGLVEYVKSNAASAVGESRLPIAFYGLSYIPLLLSLTAVGRYLQRHEASVYSAPVKLFTTGLSLLLLALSWTHLKAVFPVAAINVGLFALLANTYRDQRYLAAMLASATIAIATWVPFVNEMQLASISMVHIVTSIALFAAVLAATPRLDSYLLRIANAAPTLRSSEEREAEPARYCMNFGIGLSSLLSVVWVLWVALQSLLNVSLHQGAGYLHGSLTSNLLLTPLVALLLCHIAQTIRTRSPLFAMALWSMIAFAAFTVLIQSGMHASDMVRVATIASTSASLVALLPLRKEASGNVVGVYRTAFSNVSLQHSFLVPLHAVSTAIALCLISAVLIPAVLITNASLRSVLQPEVIAWVLTWLVGWKLIFNNRLVGIITTGVTPLLVSAMVISSGVLSVTYSTLPLIWTATAVVNYAAAFRSSSLRITSTKGVALVWIYVCALLSLASFDHVARLTAIASLAMIAMIERSKFDRRRWTELAMVGNMQALMFIAGCCGVQSWFDLAGNAELWRSVLPFVSLGIACSGALWDIRKWSAEEALRSATSATLRAAFIALACASIALHSFNDVQTIVMISAFAVAATVEFAEAVRLQRIAHVWSSFVIVFSAVGWLAFEGRLLLGTGVSQIALITISALSLLIARLIRDHEKLRFATAAFDHVGLSCPAVVVALTLFASVQQISLRAIGADSAVMLAAAGIYFHRGLATRNRKLVVASAVILNIGLAHLWNAFNLYDLQLYLVPLGLTVIAIVELMKKEIPHAAHNPIRNIGSLIILVSPVFNILSGSWTHLVCLLVLSVLVILLAIGLRLRTLVFMGSGFLFADLVALVIKSAIANPGMLWIGGLGIGIAVIVLAAICENHREQLLAKIRLISAELATWN